MWIAPSGVCLIDGYEYSRFLASLELLVRQNPSPTSRSRIYGHVRPPSSEMAMLSGARGVPQKAGSLRAFPAIRYIMRRALPRAEADHEH